MACEAPIGWSKYTTEGSKYFVTLRRSVQAKQPFYCDRGKGGQKPKKFA